MQEQINEQNAKINMTVNDDSDFLSPYAETGKPVISSEVAEFLENSANPFTPIALTTMKKSCTKKLSETIFPCNLTKLTEACAEKQ